MINKSEVQTMEVENGTSDHINAVALYENYPEAKRKAIIRKMDMRIPPVLMLLYCMWSSSNDHHAADFDSDVIPRSSEYW